MKCCILQAQQDAFISAGREVPAELENKLQAVGKKMTDLGVEHAS